MKKIFQVGKIKKNWFNHILRFCEPGEGYGTPAEQPTAAERSEARTVRVTEAWNSPVLTAKQSKRPINV